MRIAERWYNAAKTASQRVCNFYPPAPTDADAIQRLDDALSTSIRRSMLTLLLFFVFCLAVLGTPDAELLLAENVGASNLSPETAEVLLPFAQTTITFEAFLYAGPLIFVSILIYLHVFIGYQLSLHRTASQSAEWYSLPFLFNLHHPVAKLLSVLIFYLSCPILLFLFFWKAHPIVAGKWTWYLFLLSTLTVASVATLRVKPGYVRKFVSIATLSIAILLVASPIEYEGLFGAEPPSALRRGLNINGIRLEERQLVEESLLVRASIRRSSFKGAEFVQTDLWQSDARRSVFTNVNISGMDATRSILTASKFDGARIIASEFASAKLVGANLANTRWVSVNFSNADLYGAYLAGASLRDVDLQGADLKHAVLDGADLLGVRGLTPKQVGDACTNENTRLPRALSMTQYEEPSECEASRKAKGYMPRPSNPMLVVQ